MANIQDRDRRPGPGPFAWLLTLGLTVALCVFILRRSETPPVKAESVGVKPVPAAVIETTETNTPPVETPRAKEEVGGSQKATSNKGTMVTMNMEDLKFSL
jgi:hypothetical protein